MHNANNKQHRSIWFFFVSITLLLVFQAKCFAAAALVVTPTRVAFEGRTRTAQVTLLNNGTETGTYRVSFVRRHMLENGNLIEVKEGEPGNFSDELIRYSPRQVTLPPGQSQVIRLLLRKPRDLADGEYRSHMLFQSLPKARDDIANASDKNKEGISIHITSIVGITIPVIVRQGKLDATLDLEEPEYIAPDEKNKYSRLAVSMIRSGTRSVHGDFTVTYTNEGETTGKIVSQAKGVATYTPNTKRRFVLKLDKPPGIEFDKGTFDIVYSEQTKKHATGIVSKTSLTIP